ncbi:hypothetical protein PHYPSEUDO_011548 [Phytophthora pseudosyringae]|uniref:Uncharacterized protein n=1 Tax=Phytophthora pseudosyringae TaxID=221518 RepID=A0A8T1VD94_9STRA|nr:hypothetical protein PHYPSEUDO_011548 [Phytophthora pseudosyringae]
MSTRGRSRERRPAAAVPRQEQLMSGGGLVAVGRDEGKKDGDEVMSGRESGSGTPLVTAATERRLALERANALLSEYCLTEESHASATTDAVPSAEEGDGNTIAGVVSSTEEGGAIATTVETAPEFAMKLSGHLVPDSDRVAQRGDARARRSGGA